MYLSRRGARRSEPRCGFAAADAGFATLAGVAATVAGVVATDPVRAWGDLAALVALLAMAVVSGRHTRVLTRAEFDHRVAALIDDLTGLLNRKALEGRFERERQQAVRRGGTICFVLCDVETASQSPSPTCLPRSLPSSNQPPAGSAVSSDNGALIGVLDEAELGPAYADRRSVRERRSPRQSVAVDEGAVRRSKIGNVSTIVSYTDDRVIPTDLIVVKHHAGIHSTDDRILDQVESCTRAFAACDDQRDPHGCPSYRVDGLGGQLASLPGICNHLATRAGGEAGESAGRRPPGRILWWSPSCVDTRGVTEPVQEFDRVFSRR